MKVYPLVLMAAAMAAGCASPGGRAVRGGGAENPETSFVLHPIGRVATTNGQTFVVLEKAFQPGLMGLEQFSHMQVFWWFDKNDTPSKRAILQVHPRGNPENPLRGVFATRSPFRPNLIALSLCKIVAIRGNIVEIEEIDAFPGTPVLDIKPFIPGYDTTEGAKGPGAPK